MFVNLLFLAFSCFVVTVRTQDGCERWKEHPNFQLLHSEDDCGKAKINQELGSRIFNGKTAVHGSLPWMARLIIHKGKLQTACGGSVINDKYILTAAHCFMKLNNYYVEVILGLHNQNFMNDGVAQRYYAAKVIVHPNFNMKGTSDIALVRLQGSFSSESLYINYICLPTTCELAKKSFLGEHLTTAGWGHIGPKEKASTLQKAELSVKECPRYIQNGVRLRRTDWTTLCAGNNEFMVCRGDSGGPLVYETPGGSVQVGITSATPGNCTWGTQHSFENVDFFTRVASYMDWILDNIEP